MDVTTIQVVATADHEDEKGFFSSSSLPRSSVQAFSIDLLAAHIRATVNAFAEALSSAIASPSPLNLKIEKAELSLEVTAKGEVRLIASGSIETKGAIKITLAPRT